MVRPVSVASYIPEIGAVIVMLAGLVLIGFGKQTETVTVILGAAAGFLFGKHSNKTSQVRR